MFHKNPEMVPEMVIARQSVALRNWHETVITEASGAP